MTTHQSARILGRGYGLTAAEMNLLLKDEGFLEGAPGMWRVTENGLRFASEQFHSRGTGGSAQYNPYWETRTWDPSIVNNIDVTDGRVRAIRETARSARQAKATSGSVLNAAPSRAAQTAARDSGTDTLRVVAAVALTASCLYAIWKATPHVQKAWAERARPKLNGWANRESRSGPNSGDA